MNNPSPLNWLPISRRWPSRVPRLLVAFTLTLCLPTWAATTAEEERAKRCPDGHYSGPHEGARRFYQDPYAWVVSREFAERFCMPESYIDDTLKGALALAVRIKPEEFTYCDLVVGPGQCPPNQKLVIDVYIDNQSVSLPKADPSVSYYSGRVENSGALIEAEITKNQRRRNGDVIEMEGERRPFHPSGHSAADGSVIFRYLSVRNGWAHDAGGFAEGFYRRDWAKGIDLMTLDGYRLGHHGLLNMGGVEQSRRMEDLVQFHEEGDLLNPAQQWAIGVVKAKEYLDQHKSNAGRIRFPSGFDHVIFLPQEVARMIHRYDQRQGELYWRWHAILSSQAKTKPKNCSLTGNRNEKSSLA